MMLLLKNSEFQKSCSAIDADLGVLGMLLVFLSGGRNTGTNICGNYICIILLRNADLTSDIFATRQSLWDLSLFFDCLCKWML